MEVTWRRAKSPDLGAIVSIENSWPTTPHWSRHQFEAELSSERSCLIVAQRQRRILGYAGFWNVAGEAQIMTLAVHPGQARRGIGRGLLQYLLDTARSAACTRATLEVSERNQPAVLLYRSLGFAVVGRRPKYYNDGSDALLMDKDLV